MSFINRRHFVIGIFFILGMGIIIGSRFVYVQKIDATPFIPEKSTFAANPPAQSITGRFVFLVGTVKKFPRTGTDFEPVTKDDHLLGGELIATIGKGSARIDFPNVAFVTLQDNTEIGLINLIPSQFLLQQKAGSVKYELAPAQKISIRSLHTLFVIDSGETSIMMNSTKNMLTVTVFSGKVTFALSDLDNKTHVWSIKKGEKAIINDEDRSVIITNNTAI